MFYSMAGICKITQWQHCSIYWQQVEIYIVLMIYQPDKIILQVSVLMINYLVAVSFELWIA